MTRLSIVTPSLDHARFLEDTLRSVLEQEAELEYIVVDGGSSDESLEILGRYGDSLRWISESDRGQAHAINKGFELASGDVFGWLNADDLYLPGALAAVVRFFTENPEADFVFGHAIAIDERGREYGRRMNVGPSDLESLVHEVDSIVQPAAFWRAGLWRRLGPLDESLRYVMDYEYWMRAAQVATLHHLDRGLAKERIYPGAKTFGGGVERIREIETIARRFGAPGVPRGFRAEASAVYLSRAFSLWIRADWRRGAGSFRKGLSLLRSPLKVAAYLLGSSLLGWKRVSTLRLWSNLLRTKLWRRRASESGQGR